MTFMKPDSYGRIKGYAAAFIDFIQQLPNGKGIAAPQAGDDVFAVFMEKGDVARLLLHPKCNKLAAIIGIADHGDDNPNITISLLAIGADGKVLPEHRKTDANLMMDDPELPGEEVWPEKKRVQDFGNFLP